MAKITLPKECNDLCRFRDCFRIEKDKGPYTPGKGYTSYYKNPEVVCMTRLLHGCPGPFINGKFKRPMPNWEDFIKEEEEKINATKCTQKVRGRWNFLLQQFKILVGDLKDFEEERLKQLSSYEDTMGMAPKKEKD